MKYIIQKKQGKLGTGDKVRIQKELLPFRKGYLPKWTEEIFTINRKYDKPTKPMYALIDEKNRSIIGRFYPEEVQEINTRHDAYFRIEKILRTKGTGSNKKYLIRWLGYTPEFDSWINANEIQQFKDVVQ